MSTKEENFKEEAISLVTFKDLEEYYLSNLERILVEYDIFKYTIPEETLPDFINRIFNSPGDDYLYG